MKSSRKRKVTAAFFAAAALGGVAHAAPTLNMNDLVGSNTTTESTAQGNNNIATPVVRPMATQPTPVTTQSVPKVTPLIPRVRPVPVNDIAKALSDQQRAVSQPQYVVNKQTNAVMEPTLAMHSLMNVQRKTEPVTVQKQVDGKQQIQTTQVQRTPVVVQEQSTMPLTVANTITTKPVVAKQKLTIRDIQRAERERLAQLAAEEAAQQEGTSQVDQQMVAQKQAEAQRQAVILAEQQRQMAMQAEQQQAEAQRQAAEQERLRIQEEQRRIAQQQAEAQRQAALKAEQQRIAAEQAEAQRQVALKAEQDRIAAQQAEQQRIAAEQAEQARIAEAQRQAAEQERLRIQEEQRRIAQQQAEAQRQAAMQAEQQRIAAEQAEAQRQAALKAEQQRIAAEQAEAQRQAAMQAEQQRIAAEQAEAQRQAAMQAEQQRIAAEQAEAQRQAALKAEQDRIAAQQAEQQRIAAEQAEAQRQAALKAEQERIATEQAARQRAEAAAKAEAERQAAIKAEQERIAAEQAEAQRQATLKAEQDRIAAEQAKAEREAALKAEQDRIAAQQAEMARQAAIKEEQERLAAEQLAKEEAEAAAKAQAEAEAKAKADAEAKAKVQALAEAAAKAQAEAEAKAKAQAEAEAKAKAQENKLPQSYVDARNEASTKGAGVTEEKNILSQPIEPPLQADTSAKISLAFDVKNYESMSTTVDNKEIKYRAFEYIPYVANPIDIDQQYMNIYVPEEYFNNGTVNGYNTQTAPIFMPNAVGGYMPSQAMTPKVKNGQPNSVLYALSRGYVVASPATRGRTNKASDGNFIGKAPAVIVDLQAATAYLHANDSVMPGNANCIITNGTSAGGGISLLQGATGNSSDFQPYLQALGAATAATNVYAVSAYAPITNLDAADMAYEWSYNGITSSNKVSMNHDDMAYSNLLNEHFPDYVNNLQLHDSVGRVLKLDKNGNGTFKNYVKEFIVAAANKAQAKGTDLSKHTYLVRDNKTGTIKDINWEAYNQFVSRSKAPGAFDSRSNDSGENNLFGTSTTDNNHFTITAALHDTTSNPEAYVQNAKVVTMMNPMNYLGSPAATNAQFYRIRYGTADSNTSVAIPLIVGTRAQNLGYKVDMATPFDVNHSGDYDLDELFNWMDNIVKNGR